ncbi:hypothetical protein HPB48_003646 [Haemaphysalis longicornis]|uniref:Uncharacterized protein n=1 Tax=Haemaphysalis longicornis TaxID=44386 RepID=A0A9J6FHW8_HAELO|nr:hypothetical protein HPB48_003646 [Haemaphysalis longicornis]
MSIRRRAPTPGSAPASQLTRTVRIPSSTRRPVTRTPTMGLNCTWEKRLKRRLLAASWRSSTSTVKPVPKHPVQTILFVPEAKTDNLRLLKKQSVSAFLEATVPGEVKDVRINSRRNILTIDVEDRAALEALRKITSLQDIKLRAHATPYVDMTIGVIYDVDTCILDKDLRILIKPADEGIVIRQLSRIGTSRCLKIVFRGDSLPAHVKVGHFRQPVRPYEPKTPPVLQVHEDWPCPCSMWQRHFMSQMRWAPQG